MTMESSHIYAVRHKDLSDTTLELALADTVMKAAANGHIWSQVQVCVAFKRAYDKMHGTAIALIDFDDLESRSMALSA